jgi:hypothetical protein
VCGPPLSAPFPARAAGFSSGFASDAFPVAAFVALFDLASDSALLLVSFPKSTASEFLVDSACLATAAALLARVPPVCAVPLAPEEDDDKGDDRSAGGGAGVAAGRLTADALAGKGGGGRVGGSLLRIGLRLLRR